MGDWFELAAPGRPGQKFSREQVDDMLTGGR